MTDEEMAEEYVIKNICENCNRCQSKGYIGCDTYRFAKKTYIDSAKENGIVWHDLREDPNDLPRERTSKFSIDVMTDMGEGYILYESGCWHIWKYNGTVPVSRWCEISQFKE